MKFKFSFDKLLKHRTMLEEIARKEFALARGKVDDAERDLKRMYDDIAAARERGGRLGAAGGDIGGALGQIDEFINGQKIRIQHQREKIRMLMVEADRKHEELVVTAREKKTLEKLKERRLEEFEAEMKKREMKEIDDMVTTRFKKEVV